MGRRVNLIEVIKSCELRFGRGNAAQWTHSDFIDLSKDIFRSTNVNISINTLKRIFGKLAVDKKYIPQEATIEALQKYSENIFPEKSPRLVDVHVGDIRPAEPMIQWSRSLYVISLIILVVSGLVLWKYIQPAGSIDAKIVLKKTEGVLPLTAVFELQVPQTNDSFFVSFGDKSPLVYVSKGQKMIAHNYLFSGVFKVAVFVHQSVVAETTVSVSSDKWIALSYHDPLRNHYYEIPAVKTTADSLFNLTNRQLHQIGLDTALRIFTRLYNYTPVNYFADDFIFETTFKNPPRKNSISCNSTQFQISGINGMIRFKLSSPGCTSRVINVLSEQRYDGDKSDLTRFVLEQEAWNSVRMINRNKQVSLFVNGELLFTGTYQKSLGEIKGLFIEFEGNGFVKKCDLTAGNGRRLYHF